jgi:hypothetical protein
MYTLNPINYKYVLEGSIEDLHKESKEWISELEFWKVEFSFFEKLIDEMNLLRRGQSKEDLQQIYNNGKNLLSEISDILDNIRDHQKYLALLLEKKDSFNDQKYREDHHRFHSLLSDQYENFKDYKRRFYNISENYLREL